MQRLGSVRLLGGAVALLVMLGTSVRAQDDAPDAAPADEPGDDEGYQQQMMDSIWDMYDAHKAGDEDDYDKALDRFNDAGQKQKDDVRRQVEEADEADTN